MQFVNYPELDKTINALVKLRAEIKSDERIKMDNALAHLITRAQIVARAIESDTTPEGVYLRARALQEAVKAYERQELGNS